MKNDRYKIFQYAILLSMVLVLHVATAITGLMLGVCRSKEIVSETLTAFMHSYDYDTILRDTMDLTQLNVRIFWNFTLTDLNSWTINFKPSTSVVETMARKIGIMIRDRLYRKRYWRVHRKRTLLWHQAKTITLCQHHVVFVAASTRILGAKSIM